jgi:hypothetical protein
LAPISSPDAADEDDDVEMDVESGSVAAGVSAADAAPESEEHHKKFAALERHERSKEGQAVKNALSLTQKGTDDLPVCTRIALPLSLLEVNGMRQSLHLAVKLDR